MIVSGHVPENYPTIQSGIAALIASGTASGAINEYYLYVDDSCYTGVFSASVPNSGIFYLIGSGTVFSPSGTCTVYTEGDGSFNIQNLCILGEDTNNWLFHISGSSALVLDNATMVGCNDCIYSIDGNLSLINSNTCGSGIFYSGSSINLESCSISDFSKGVYASSSRIVNSNIFDCNTAIEVPLSGSLTIAYSLIHSGTYGILKASSTTSTVDFCTIESTYPIYGSGGLVYIESSILKSHTRCVNGFLDSGSVLSNCCTYPSGWLTSDVTNEPSGSNLSITSPKFNNSTIGDYRLQFAYVSGCPFIEHTSKSVPSDVKLRSEATNVVLTDYKGVVSDNVDHRQFIYKQGYTLLFTDYEKEIEYANFIDKKRNLQYYTTTNALFSVYEQNLKSCFSNDGLHQQPYDWDLINIYTTELLEDNTDTQYIIPRSYLDLKPIINNKLSFLGDVDFRYDLMSKANVKVFNKEESRGISYDYNLSDPGKPIVWRLEGRNQLLIKQNIFTGEYEDIYPLSCPNLGNNKTINVSGLVYVGPYENKFRFVDVNDPNKEYIAETEGGYFKWIDTTINPQLDARGILAHKDNLYITATRYSEDIYDRTSVPVRDGGGLLLKYSNNHLFSHYTKYLDQLSGQIMPLYSGNYLPTDITIYEDGTVLIADYSIYDSLFKYKFAYDYAMLDYKYDKSSKVLLREYYPSVDF